MISECETGERRANRQSGEGEGTEGRSGWVREGGLTITIILITIIIRFIIIIIINK